jgi:glutathione S-transferase
MSSFQQSIKLSYFNIEGPAEKVRLALTVAGVPFEDVRVNFADWPALKPTTPGGQLPVMEIGGGKMVTQSGAMARYAARLGDGSLYPVDDVDKCFLIDRLIGMQEDDARDFSVPLYMGMNPSKFGYPDGYGKTDEGKEMCKNMREAFVADSVPKTAKLLMQQLKESGGPFLCGAGLTLADLYWLPRLRYLTAGIADHVDPKCLDAFPEVLAYKEAMMNVPAIKKWYEKK